MRVIISFGGWRRLIRPTVLKPGDLTDPARMARRTDEQLFDVIFYGGPELTLSERMPAWTGLLSKDEVNLLVKYVRSLSADSTLL